MYRQLPKIYLCLCLGLLCMVGTSPLVAFSNSPKAGLDSLGNAVACWLGFDSSGNQFIQASTQKNGGTWTTPVTISTAGQFGTEPVIIVDSSDNAVAIWTAVDTTTNNTVLFGSMLVAGTGGTWNTPVQISSSTTNILSDYTLVLNNNKNVLALWSAYDSTGTALNVFASTAKVGGTWSAPAQVSQ